MSECYQRCKQNSIHDITYMIFTYLRYLHYIKFKQPHVVFEARQVEEIEKQRGTNGEQFQTTAEFERQRDL